MASTAALDAGAGSLGHKLAQLKTALLADGLRVPADAAAVLAEAESKPVMRVRSGSCGGLDLILPDGTYVNCPIHEHFARHSPFALAAGDGDGELVLSDGAGRFEDVTVRPVPTPAYYSGKTAAGSRLASIGQLCSDRVGIGLTNVCTYWRSSSSRCRFCSIGLNTVTERGNKALADMVEAVGAAYADAVAPARHLLLGGGTPDGPDAGAIGMAAVARAVKERWPEQPVYAMLAPPADLRYLELLKDSGVDEIGMNVEMFSEDAAERFMPGKHAAIPLERYLVALERAVELFGPVNTRSIAIVGLEPVDCTLAGVEQLASRGVMPILSPFRPLVGTQLEHHPRLTADELWDVALAASEAAGRHGIPLGPTCIPCQSNTLTVPGHPAYRFY